MDRQAEKYKPFEILHNKFIDLFESLVSARLFTGITATNIHLEALNFPHS
jgi:hypothetical protein